MSKNLWLPFWINIALLLCAIPTISTLPTTSTLPSISPEGVLQQSEEEAETLLESRDTSSNRYANAFETDPTILQNIMHALRKMRRLVIGRRSFQILLCSFFLTALASSDTKLLVQYISKRYEWTFAQVSDIARIWRYSSHLLCLQAGYMLSAKALVNFTLLAIVVPRMIHTSISAKTAAHDSEVRFNIWGAEVSIAVSVIGVLCVAMAFKFWMLLTGKLA